MYYIKKLAKNKEMERFTSDGGHLGHHLEYLKLDSDSMHLPLPKSAKTCLGGIFCKVDLKIRVLLPD